MYQKYFQWTTDSGLTHIFTTNYILRNEGFGWSSLCDDRHLPIEGEHFELHEHVAEGSVTCDHCLEQMDRMYEDSNKDGLARMRSCLIRISRDTDGRLLEARRLCRGRPLHHDLGFEPESFSGDLREEVDNVCGECWKSYSETQWSGNVEGGELQVECWTDRGKETYYAVSADAINTGHTAKLRLTSENGLKQELPREYIESIKLTPAQIVDY